jgi:hypothetical protein
MSEPGTASTYSELALLVERHVPSVDVIQVLRRRRGDLINQLLAYVVELDLQHAMSSLSLDGADRIARAPLFAAFHVGNMTADERRPMLRDWLDAERLRVTMAARPVPRWTALGDVFLATNRDYDYFAPSAGGIVIDGQSPLAQTLPFLPEALRSGAIPATRPHDAAVALQAALDLVQAIDSATFGFITAALASIVVYETPQKAGSFSSSSSRSFSGSAMVSNVTGEHVDQYRLADALVHEAVHGYLYAVEPYAPLVWPDRRFEPQVISPWTSNTLPLHAFTHACFVWLALLRFWTIAVEHGVFHESSVAHYRARALSGFVGNQLDDALAGIWTAIPEAARHALGQVRQAARGYT